MTDLLRLVGVGDQEAFGGLYRSMQPPVCRYAASVLGDEALAEEVAQEVLLEVWLKAAGFDPERASAYTWIMVIARRRSVDRVRRFQGVRVRDDKYFRQSAHLREDDVAELVARRLAARAVQRGLVELSDLQREALVLAFYEGHSYPVVATLLEVPTATAKTRIRDGLRRLRMCLCELGEAT